MCLLLSRAATLATLIIGRGAPRLLSICYEMRKERNRSRAVDRSSREAETSPVRIRDFPRDAEEKEFGGSELPLHVCVLGPRAWRYSEVGLGFLACTLRRRCETEKCAERFTRRVKAPLRTGCIKRDSTLRRLHSSKLQHRAPFKIPPNLSHVRKTLESGISVPPSATSLDVVGQWLLCCAGASPTEDPLTLTRRKKNVSGLKVFCAGNVVKPKASFAAKYPSIHKECVENYE